MHMVKNLQSELPCSGKFAQSCISKERWDAGCIHFKHVDGTLLHVGDRKIDEKSDHLYRVYNLLITELQCHRQNAQNLLELTVNNPTTPLNDRSIELLRKDAI